MSKRQGSGIYSEHTYEYFNTTITAKAQRTLDWLSQNTDIVPVLETPDDSKYTMEAESSQARAVLVD